MKNRTAWQSCFCIYMMFTAGARFFLPCAVIPNEAKNPFDIIDSSFTLFTQNDKHDKTPLLSWHYECCHSLTLSF
ncbi:MAG: hypothetical protein IJD97_01450 [Clostridia bacterium]|nr:hypothetical protein [Clostridia bacterium]